MEQLKLHQKEKYQMIPTFKESFNLVIEKKLKLPSGEKVEKEIKRLGKKKNITAVITSKFNLYIDGDKLDKYKSVKDAEKSLKDFLKVMDL